MIDIERKFLVNGPIPEGEDTPIQEGYLSRNPERTVRIRTRKDKANISVKGKISADGLSRYEFKQEISMEDALNLLKICEPGVIEKTRRAIKWGEHTIKVDIFHGKYDGLVIAEVELEDPDQPFEKPEWLGEEVTGNLKYYNSNLT
ncbi:CYTH domain-containing protein [Algivirga pacifica]|uniref:CYTH domain-containing protein n=1 Tax=Algivirga pacifica TaxID=1162670 RepID=A0ABP9DLU9_9BACT